jgi:hypothetical protein
MGVRLVMEQSPFMGNPKKPEKPEVELEPDAWQRFERAVDVVAKSPPQHRVAKLKKKDVGKRKKAANKKAKA